MNTSTLLTANALLSSVASVVMFVVLRTRKTYPGFGFWVAGILCLALGAGMLIPGTLPDTWLIRVSRNALLVGGLALILRGMLVFRGHRVAYWLEALIALSFLATFGYFSIDPGALDARIVTYCIYAGALSLATVFVILYRRPADFGSNDVLLAVFLSLNGLIALIRAEQQLTLPFGTAFEASQSFGVFYAMVQILVVQMATLTLISINSQRIEWQYRISEARLRESEERLRVSEIRFRDLFVRAPIALATSDRDGKIVLMNEAFVDLFGYRPEELPTVAEWRQRALPDATQRQKHTEDWQAKWGEGGNHPASPGTSEQAVTCKDGSTKTVLLQRIHLGDDMLLAAVDISVRKLGEEDLKRRNEELERFDRAATDRELQMIALKRQVNALSVEFGRPAPHDLSFADDAPGKKVAP
jgi:PAS domain S-box-containing protein